MKLSKLYENFKNIEIYNDNNFTQLGMSTTKYSNPGVLTFLENIKFYDAIIKNKNITAIITTKNIIKDFKFPKKLGIIITEKPKYLFYQIHNYLYESNFYTNKFNTKIGENNIISNNAIVSQNNVIIGNNCIIEDNVIINSGVTIRDNVIVRSGTIIGSNGFQFLNIDKKVIPVYSTGTVFVENNVEIQHNCTIDKGVLGGETRLEEYVKIDNLVHIAHDNIIGKRTFITAGVKFGGRTVVGDDCWIGINATISNGLSIGNNVKVSLGSVVTKDIEDNSVVTGNFAIDHKKFIQFIKSIR